MEGHDAGRPWTGLGPAFETGAPAPIERNTYYSYPGGLGGYPGGLGGLVHGWMGGWVGGWVAGWIPESPTRSRLAAWGARRIFPPLSIRLHGYPLVS